MRPLGVGLVYWAELEPLLQPGGPAVGVVELEPQTLWEMVRDGAGWRYRANEALLDRVDALPQLKLLHGVGHPVGGTVPDPTDPVPLLRRAVDRLKPEWVSEHLSFNRVRGARGVVNAGFLLPPLQAPATVRVAAGNIDSLRRSLDRPVAFETGVNYLRPHDGELDDGAFFSAVAEASDSGIVLDLHNLWCNQCNGRQSVARALSQLPLDRVWEIHLAGGMQQGGYWLDAHCGAVPPQVLEIAASVIPRLDHLGALIFEVLPEHLPRIGLDGVQRQIEGLQELWALRPPTIARVPRLASRATEATLFDQAQVAAWENALVDAIGARPTRRSAASLLATDPGCRLLSELITDFRKANLARALRYSMTFLLAGLGARCTHELIECCFDAHPPEPFAALEADCFAQFLRARLTRLPHLPHFEEVLAFEHALVRATTHGESCEIAWTADPVQLFDALDAGRLPSGLPVQPSTLRICAA